MTDDRRTPTRSRLDPEPVPRRDFLGLAALVGGRLGARCSRIARHAAAAARPRCCRRRRRSSASRCPRRSPPGEAVRAAGALGGALPRRRAASTRSRPSARTSAASSSRTADGLRLPVPRLALRARRRGDQGAGAEGAAVAARSRVAAGTYRRRRGATVVPPGTKEDGMSADSRTQPRAARASGENLRDAPRRVLRDRRSAAARRRPTARARRSSSATSSCTCTRCARTAGRCAGRTTWGLGIATRRGVPHHARHRHPADVLLQAVSRRGLRLDQGHPLRRADRAFIRNIHRWAAQRDGGRRCSCTWRASFYTAAYRKPREFNWLIGMGLLVVTLGLSFTGYLLPWDQLAYWAITIGANIAQSPREVTDALGITGYFDPGGLQKLLLLGSDDGRRGGADPLLPAARDDPAAGAGGAAGRALLAHPQGRRPGAAGRCRRAARAAADRTPIPCSPRRRRRPTTWRRSCAGARRRSGAGPENTRAVDAAPVLRRAGRASCSRCSSASRWRCSPTRR